MSREFPRRYECVSIWWRGIHTRCGRVWFSEIDWWTTLLLLYHSCTPVHKAIYEESISHREFGTEMYSLLLHCHRHIRGKRMRVYGLSRIGCAMEIGNSLQCTSCIIVSILLKFKLNYKLAWCWIHKFSEICLVKVNQISSYLLKHVLSFNIFTLYYDFYIHLNIFLNNLNVI